MNVLELEESMISREREKKVKCTPQLTNKCESIHSNKYSFEYNICFKNDLFADFGGGGVKCI